MLTGNVQVEADTAGGGFGRYSLVQNESALNSQALDVRSWPDVAAYD